jgi:hypothetical protein
MIASVAVPLLLGIVSPALAAAVAATPAPVVEAERFRLQSNPWVNLHERLLYQATIGAPDPAGLTAEETGTWTAAVDAYRAWASKRSPIFDAELIAVSQALSEARGGEPPEAIPEAARKVLAAAMPLYQKEQWNKDDTANRFWIAVAGTLLRECASELAAAHEKAYGVPFTKRALVDASPFAGEFGGYTVGDAASVHTIISSTETGYAGFAALEMLMHEASHGIVAPNSGAIGADLARIAKETGRRPPPGFWHALLFYTSGELTRRTLAARGVAEYRMAIEGRLFNGPFKGLQEPFETHWRAWLDGTLTRDEAIRRILLTIGREGGR